MRRAMSRVAQKKLLLSVLHATQLLDEVEAVGPQRQQHAALIAPASAAQPPADPALAGDHAWKHSSHQHYCLPTALPPPWQRGAP